MPAFDGTGPRGLGRMTGRGFGYCAGYSPTNYSPYGYQQPMMPSLPSAYPSYPQYAYQPEQAGYPAAMPMQQPYYSNFPFGPGLGYGRGLGLGWGRGFGPGLGYGRGLGLGWGRGFGPGLGYGRGLGLGWGRGFF
jgi:hypothetical protein